MKHQIIRYLGMALLFLCIKSYSQSVGIGTETPNSNAILELVAPDANQGLLVPRLSTSERTAASFISNLSTSDNGLLVYDSDEQKFYFWIIDQWVELASGNVDALPDQSGQSNRFLTTDGTNAQWSEIDFTSLTNVPSDLEDGDDDTQLSDADITALGYIKSADDADANASNEIQDLTLSGNTLSLTSSAVGIDLSPFSGTNTDNQTLSLSSNDLTISGGNTIDISSINTNLTEVEVDAFVSDNGFLTSEVDGSVTNEIQDISTDGTAGDITLSSGSSLTLNVDDADSDPTNEDQTVSAGAGISVNNVGDDFEVTNTAPDQPISLTNAGNVTITGSYPNFTLAVPTNNDNSVSNEIQDISTDGTAGDITLSSGSSLTLNVDDADSDNTNEFQDLSLSGSTLSLSNSAVNIDLSPFSGTNTDNQTLSLSGTNLTITGGNTLDLASIDTQLSEAEVDGFANNNGYLTATDIAGYDSDASDDFDGAFASLSGIPAGLGNGDDDTQLSEAEVDAFVNNNGYLTAVDIAGYDSDASDDFDGAFASLSGIPAGLGNGDDDTQLSEAEVDAFVNNNGYLTAEVDGSTANELNTGMSLVGTTIRVTDAGGIQSVNIGGTFATDSELASSDAADGDKDDSNEYNTGMSLSGTTIRVTDGGGTRSVNIGGTFATDSELDSKTFTPSAFKATIKSGTIPVGVTNLAFDTEAYDIDNSFESGVFTAPEDGLYNLGGLMIFQNVPTGLVQIIIRDGDSNILYSKAFAPSSIQSSIAFSADLQLAAGDKVNVALSNTTLGGSEAQAIQIIASPDVSNFFFCGKRFN